MDWSHMQIMTWRKNLAKVLAEQCKYGLGCPALAEAFPASPCPVPDKFGECWKVKPQQWEHFLSRLYAPAHETGIAKQEIIHEVFYQNR